MGPSNCIISTSQISPQIVGLRQPPAVVTACLYIHLDSLCIPTFVNVVSGGPWLLVSKSACFVGKAIVL